ncbi:MAG: LuxR C-terminal-related transcriptional regulator [Desulfovibrio sp.]|uniref:LuxR C-terminal-related transcriptional regulator n=1 Tax=Desulfovibrio sp. TaxID=885 RepID=UPI0039E3A156
MQQKTPSPQKPRTAALYFTPRLTGALSSILDVPLTFVEAPMGYGKTVAVREILATIPARAIWVSVHGPSSDAFWRTLCRELASAFPRCAAIAESLLLLGYPYDTARAHEAREIFSGFSFNCKIVLIVDDVHFLDDDGRGLTTLCDLLAQSDIPNLRLTLISRAAYTGRQEFLELKSLFRQVGREYFTLAPDDIQHYYAACGVTVDVNEARALHEQTGGWISALYLRLLHQGKGGAFDPQKGGVPPLNGLIEKELYAPLSPALKELLFALAPLEQATAAQADFLFNSDSSPLLDELVRKNSFVFLDPASATYTPHSIFRQYILELFARQPKARQKAAHARCGEWFRTRGEAVQAIDAFYAAEDFESALTVLESDMGGNYVTEKARFFVDMFKACPEEILARHLGAAFKYAIAAFSAADFPAFGAQVGWLTQHCAALPQGRAGDVWRGELEFLLSLAAFNDIEAMSAHHRRANALLARPTRLFGRDSPWTLGSPSVLFMFYRESGQLAEEIRRMHECLPHYYTLASGHGSGGEYLLEAEAAYNAGNFEQAAVICHKAEAMALRHSQLSNVLCAFFLRMRLALVTGNFTEARRLVNSMRGLIKKSRDYFLLHTVDICQGWLYVALGQTGDRDSDRTGEEATSSGGSEAETVPAWLRSDLGEDSRLYAFARGTYYIVHGKLLLLSGQYTKILGLFGYLLEKDVFGKNLLFAIYAGIYQAAALLAMGKNTEAANTLRQALETALPDGLYMPFAENGDFLAPLLAGNGDTEYGNMTEMSSLRTMSPYCSGLAAIRRLTAAWQKSRNGMVTRHFSRGKSPLTKRELQLARLAASGKSYAAIATELYIAPTTVKKIFANIHKKLGIHSRSEIAAWIKNTP